MLSPWQREAGDEPADVGRLGACRTPTWKGLSAWCQGEVWAGDGSVGLAKVIRRGPPAKRERQQLGGSKRD